jgi:hypothetical protein
MSAIAEFRRPPPIAPPDASPLLGSILLAIALCERTDQIAAWWDWPAHREARWHLSPEESAQAADAMDRRRCEFSAAT